MMKREFSVELTTMCMICNAKQEILMLDRKKELWPGWTFPGGHVETNESMTAGVIREVFEETGLMVRPQLAGIAEWLNGTNGERELAALFTANTEETTLQSSPEGALFWLPKEHLQTSQLAGTLHDLLPLFLGDAFGAFMPYQGQSFLIH